DERRHFNHRQPRCAQAIDELDLVGGGDVRALVLEPITRTHLDNGDHCHSRSTASASTSSPSRHRIVATTPSSVAPTGRSIFIASSSTRTSPFFTASPGLTLMRRTVAGIGAVTAPSLPATSVPPCLSVASGELPPSRCALRRTSRWSRPTDDLRPRQPPPKKLGAGRPCEGGSHGSRGMLDLDDGS